MNRSGNRTASQVARTVAAALAAACLVAAPATQAAPLLLQPPSQAAGALANGTMWQAPLLAETFGFSGTATSLSWWGTGAVGLEMSLRDSSGTVLSFGAAPVHAEAAGFNVLVDVDGDLVDDVAAVYRYWVDFANLAAGSYTLAVRDAAADDAGMSWFWLHGSGGDGQSISGLDDPARSTNAFDLSLRVDGTPARAVPEPAALSLVLLGGWLAMATSKRGRRRHDAATRAD